MEEQPLQNTPPEAQQLKKRFSLSFLKNISKKQKIIITAVCILILVGVVGASVYAYYKQANKHIDCVSCVPTPSPTPTPTPEPTPTPSTTEALLNGRLVPLGSEAFRPLAVMIENHPEARPQYGLGQADLVYEAIAEGGITRFMAVFGNPGASDIRVGPIRSARTYYVDFATELGAFYAHVGGSEPALSQIKRTGVLDLDQFSVGAAAYQRDFSRKVALEHTMYSATAKLWNFGVDKRGWPKTADFKPWKFTDDRESDKRPTSHTVSVSVSSPQYRVAWTYDPTTNSYTRSMAGAIHLDAGTNEPIKASSIILQTVTKKPVVQSNGKQVWDYDVNGSGKAVIIQNGSALQATWKKEGTERTRYWDDLGKEISIVRGSIWVHIIHPDSTVSY